MQSFELFQPASAAEAIAKTGEDAALKAGGTDLLDRMKERTDRPQTVIDLLSLRAPELRSIAAADDGVTIGALAVLSDVETAEALADPAYRAITAAAYETATPQIRNRATVAGNLLQQTRCWYFRSASLDCAHGNGEMCLAQDGENRYHAVIGCIDCVRVHPSNLAPALLAMDARMTVHGRGGTDERDLAALFPDTPEAKAPEHTLKLDEIITSIRVPAPAPDTRSAYCESREKLSFDWATTAAAVRVRIADGRIAECKICLGAVAPVPVVAGDAGAQLVGAEPTVERFIAAAETAFRGAEPLRHNGYKIPLGKAVLVDALCEAAGIER